MYRIKRSFQEMRIAVYTAMHGRKETVKECFKYLYRTMYLAEGLIDIDFIYGYTTEEDREFLRFLETYYPVKAFQAPNEPLWKKFHGGMDILKNGDYDACIMIGSDDIFDFNYLLRVSELINHHDYIASEDIYFHDRISGKNYYWKGYENYRKGEPAGAGKVYTRKAMEAFDYKIFQPSIDKGLDKGCHDKAMELGLSFKLINCRKENLFLCDIKDGEGLTPISRFKDLGKLSDNFFGL